MESCHAPAATRADAARAGAGGCRRRRRHRYGQSARKYQQSRARMSRYEYMDDYDEEEEEEVNPSLEAIENEVIESVKRGRDKRDWPPKWSGPIVGFGTLWYVSFFFS